MKDNDSDELEDITEDVEIDEEFEEVPAAVNIYRFEIQNGHVFDGTIKSFEEKFFIFSPELSEEEKIRYIELWANEQNWSFKSYMLH